MQEINDLKLLIKSHTPIIAIETHEELRSLELLTKLAVDFNLPLYQWTTTDGLQRADIKSPFGMDENKITQPSELLEYIKTAPRKGVFALCDFHPFVENSPENVRLIKDIALLAHEHCKILIFIGHEFEAPPELRRFTRKFELSLPDHQQLKLIIQQEALRWSKLNHGKRVSTDPNTLKKLIKNLTGLTYADARCLVRNVIFDDGAITESELPDVNKAKFELLDMDGVLSFEYDTAKFSEVGGLGRLKAWLKQREPFFLERGHSLKLDVPKGILIVGIQGGGKSLAAKAVAGMWQIPLLRLDFGSLYNKYYGETEKNLRQALKTAEVMEPCVLWLDEIEKGITLDNNEGGTSKRLLATLLTWMSENKNQVFIVATANEIDQLPPELIRKGRLDEIFFVDLPDFEARKEIFKIHLSKRQCDDSSFDLQALAEVSSGFSGAEIEQCVVSSLYRSLSASEKLSTDTLIQEIKQTSPLSVVMSEKLDALRQWASSRTVKAN